MKLRYWLIRPFTLWKARRITKRFMTQFANERIEQLVAEAEAGPLYTADDIARMLGIEP